jgi:oxalate decarboxylase/phosphoglucose isomerase-like protein (cupin superfamily)
VDGIALTEKATLCREDHAHPLMENEELALIYFQSERLTFATSVLPPGARSNLDPGHPGAHEVAYCVSGELVLELGHGDGHFVRLKAGDAVLIHEGIAHTAFNPGAQPAEVVWAAAPGLGRPLVYADPDD